MSGVGKSTVIAGLAQFGYRAVDTDYGGYTVTVNAADGKERLWREDGIQELLSDDCDDVLFVSGTCRNQVEFYPQFDHIVLLSAPGDVLVERLATRNTNPYGKTPLELTETLQLADTVEPLLRKRATLEVDTRAGVEHVVAAILEHVVDRAARPAEKDLGGGSAQSA